MIENREKLLLFKNQLFQSNWFEKRMRHLWELILIKRMITSPISSSTFLVLCLRYIRRILIKLKSIKVIIDGIEFVSPIQDENNHFKSMRKKMVKFFVFGKETSTTYYSYYSELISWAQIVEIKKIKLFTTTIYIRNNNLDNKIKVCGTKFEFKFMFNIFSNDSLLKSREINVHMGNTRQNWDILSKNLEKLQQSILSIYFEILFVGRRRTVTC